jgi:predicted DNA-binding transcriptional regulator AlpA
MSTDARLERMLTTEELADVIHTTPAGVHAMRYRGVGPRGRAVGKRVLYAESDVAEWLESRADQPKGAA